MNLARPIPLVFLKARCHVERKIDDAILSLQVLRVQDNRCRKAGSVPGYELVKRDMIILARGLHLQRHDVLATRQDGLVNQEVNFHRVFPRLRIASRKKQKRVSGCRQHLRDDILDQHAGVEFKRLRKNARMNLLGNEKSFGKGQTDKKPGIELITLQRRMIRAHGKADVRFRRIEADIGDHCLPQPKERILISPHPRIRFKRGKAEFLVMVV